MTDDAKRDAVTVTFNGADKVIDYRPDELVQVLLDAAKREFGVQSNHLLGLFTEAGTELPDKEAAEKAAVKPGEVLVLRQSTVKGGL